MRPDPRLILFGVVLVAARPAAAVDLFGLGSESEPSTASWADGPKKPEPEDARRLKIHSDVVDLLSEKTKAPPEFLYGPDGTTGEPIGFAWPVGAARGDELVRAERERFAKSGYTIFVAERNFGLEPDRIGVFPATDPFAPVVARGTADPTGAVANDRLVAKLREWRQETGLELLGAGSDWVELEVVRLPDDLDRFVGEIRALAPDAVGTDDASVARFTDELRRSRRAYLWWKSRG